MAQLVSQKTHHWDVRSSLQAGVELSKDQLHQLQQLLTRMLGDIAAVCEKRSIPYYLVGGTALGAVRHGGFIPWDDDVDIAMHRKDYDRFRICFQEELGKKYYIQTPEETDGYTSLIPRIRAFGTVVRTREDLWTDEAHSGAGIDLFVIENTSNKCALRFFHGMLSLLGGGLLACRKTFAARKQLRRCIIRNSKYARQVKLRSFIGACFAWLPVNFLRKFANNCNRLCSGNTGRFVTIPAGHWRFFGDMYERKDFTESKQIDFNGIPCRISATVENYLTQCYGNWQEIPAGPEQEQHFFYAFSLGQTQTDPNTEA